MFAVEGIAEVDESAGIPLDLNHHSGHCLSFPPPGQKTIVNGVSNSIGSFADGIYTDDV